MEKEDAMPMTVGQMARLAGVSSRTLRYYEEQGLLTPSRTDAGYRIYSEEDAHRLAQILALRACNLPLPTIRRLFHDPHADLTCALRAHLHTLEEQGDSVHAAIERTKAALTAIERMNGMGTKDAFETMKEQGLQNFEEEFGEEARSRYGDDVIDTANARMMALTKDEWDAKELLEEAIKVQLRIAMANGDPASDAAQELVRMHQRWIDMHWGKDYEPAQYVALVEGYLADPRFVRYYDSAAGKGATAFLVEAVRIKR